MAQRGVGSGERGMWITAGVAIGIVGLLALCVLAVAVVLVGVGLFGVQVGGLPRTPIVVVPTPTALP